MANTVRLTWAIPVTAHLLGARLEAYVESKATISTFRLCARHGNPAVAPVAKLPAELINEILGHVGHSYFEEKLPRWADTTRCMKSRWGLPSKQQYDIEDQLNMISIDSPDSVRKIRFAKCREVQRLDSMSDGD